MKTYITIPENPAETKEAYKAPVIETVEVRVEQGFQISNPGSTEEADALW